MPANDNYVDDDEDAKDDYVYAVFVVVAQVS